MADRGGILTIIVLGAIALVWVSSRGKGGSGPEQFVNPLLQFSGVGDPGTSDTGDSSLIPFLPLLNGPTFEFPLGDFTDGMGTEQVDGN